MHQSKSPGVQAGVIRERPHLQAPRWELDWIDALAGLLSLASPLSQVSPRMEELSAWVSVQGNLEQVMERLETHLECASRSLVPR
jgi:hypothetical protein